jgi:hypothetical protein
MFDIANQVQLEGRVVTDLVEGADRFNKPRVLVAIGINGLADRNSRNSPDMRTSRDERDKR